MEEKIYRSGTGKMLAQKCLAVGVGFTWATLAVWLSTHSIAVVGAMISTGVQLWIYVRAYE